VAVDALIRLEEHYMSTHQHRNPRYGFRGDHRPSEGERHRPGGEPAAEPGVHRLSRRPGAARRDRDRRRRALLLPGWDLKGAAGTEESDEDWGAGGFGGLNHPRNLDKPLIAAVNGIACGGGFEIVLGTDIIVMEEHAKSRSRRSNVGVLADAGTIKLRRRIPTTSPSSS